MQSLADFFDGSRSARFGVADTFVNRREGLVVFILDCGGQTAEVEFLRLSHKPTIAGIEGGRNG